MSKTLEQLRDQLSAIEPDDSIYDGIGPSEIPQLEQLLQHNEAWMAARAVFALSRLSDNRVVTLLSRAAVDPRTEIRVAAAASVTNVKPNDANDLLLKLLTDADAGVRKFSIQSVSGAHNNAVHVKLRDLENQDPAPWIREIAKSKLRELKLIKR